MEIRKRKVLRVVAMYSVAAWLVLQFAEVTFEPFGVPAWGMRALVMTAIAGVPIAFLVAWVVDLRPEGLIFDLPLWTAGGTRSRPPRKSDLVYLALLVASLVGGAYLAVDLLRESVSEPESLPQPEQALTVAAANTIAVLAFDNFDGDEQSDYFAAGLAEEILNLLAGLPRLRVAARTSSFRFRGQSLDIREVAKRLAVRYVLEGSVRRAGETMRVSAQLVDGAVGFNDWSEVYDRKLEDVFQVQEEIAAAVVNELSIALSIDAGEIKADRPTDDVSAYVFYLEGRGRLRASIDADVTRTAASLFQTALEMDPGFARAYSGLCEAHLRLYGIASAVEDFEVAKSACETASELDPGVNSEVALALGKLFRYRGMLEAAERKLTESLALDPKDVDAYIELGEVRAQQKRPEEAEALFTRALEVKRNYWHAHAALGTFYYRSGRYPEAAKEFQIAVRLAPDVAAAFAGLGAAYSMLGDKRKSREAYDQSLELKPSRQAFTNMGLRYYYDGQFQDAVDMQQRALEYASDDHRVWGRLAESYRFIPGAEADAERSYEAALQFAEAVLEVNAEDWETLGLLGLYSAHLGRFAEARQHVDRAVALSDRAPTTLYFMALIRYETEDNAGALAVLEELLEMDPGYIPIVRGDPDLAGLLRSSGAQALRARLLEPQ